jgi:hypothetical protein
MIDGFGHSRSEPLLRAQGGFDALFFARAAQKVGLWVWWLVALGGYESTHRRHPLNPER